MDLAEYSALDATALAELVRNREVDPRELRECAVQAATALNPFLNAVVEILLEPAAAWPADTAGPFAGVPFMLKDLFHGDPSMECGNGSRLSEGWKPEEAGSLVQRFHRAGLVNVGRTATPEFGIAGTTEPTVRGPTTSPWSPAHMAGGSSGGAAAAVGAGIVPIAHGSDGGGSIRIPASACGVVGLKPTRGRLGVGDDPLMGWSAAFPLTRSIRDTAALLDFLGGADPGDPYVIALPRRPYVEELDRDPGTLTIGFCAEPWSGKPSDPDVVAATEATARSLAGMGHRVEPIGAFFPWEPFLEAMTDVWSAGVAHLVHRFATERRLEAGPDNLERLTISFADHGRSLPATRLLDAHSVAADVSRRLGRLFADYDLLLTPTLGTAPARIGTFDPDFEGGPKAFFDAWSGLESFLPLANVSGVPAISLPLHSFPTGLPMGMQLVAPFGDEATLMRLGARLEEEFAWFDRTPPIHAGQIDGGHASGLDD